VTTIGGSSTPCSEAGKRRHRGPFMGPILPYRTRMMRGALGCSWSGRDRDIGRTVAGSCARAAVARGRFGPHLGPAG
jgi:hypothetical protein